MRMKFKFSPEEQKLWQTLQFFLRLIILSAPLYFTLFFLADLSILQALTAQNSALVLRSLGWEVIQNGPLLNLGTFSFLISPDCTGWKSMFFLFALIFAVPSPLFAACGSAKERASRNRLQINFLKKRLLGLAIGLPVIWAGNLARIILTVFTHDIYGLEMAGFVHDYLWRLGLVILVLLIWGLWLQRALISKKRQK